MEFHSIRIDEHQASEIARDFYKLEGELIPLPGELDFNFRLNTPEADYVLKISRPGIKRGFLEFQIELLNYLSGEKNHLTSPDVVRGTGNKQLLEFKDKNGEHRYVRMMTWIEGRLWSGTNPVRDGLLFSLGKEAGKITHALQGFDHPLAHRAFQWDIAQSAWTTGHNQLFGKQKSELATYFQKGFLSHADHYQTLRKAIVHNDVNDNNIIVSNDLIHPEVKAIIDYGDAIHTQVINDLAVVIAYAIMHKPDLLSAACQVVEGYHGQFPLKPEELELLYFLVGMRLVISVTKSAINKQEEPENEYLLISEQAAWETLERWRATDEQFAHFSFRKACGFHAHPETLRFKDWADKQKLSLRDLFPSIQKTKYHLLDLGMESDFLGHETEFNDLPAFELKIARLREQHPDSIPAGGYLETRPLYVTDEYRKEGNNGHEYRTVHLGIDYWLPAGTPVHALFDGEVVVAVNDAGYKAYGGLVILRHRADGLVFHTLYGHQSLSSIKKLSPGDTIKKGAVISELGDHDENGDWATHLHFQVMLDMLGHEDDFPGVTYPAQKETWADLCPDPGLFFNDPHHQKKEPETDSQLTLFRKQHLGKNLSLSYDEPLHMVRGSGAYLIDHTGRKYLDTVNNVAHVGHEHPRIVAAGQRQMALLNTNTRYLNKQINLFTSELLDTFPPELSVAFMVNSGSEANELAIRMAETCTGQKDFIAMEVGYHGNTVACVDISSYKFDGKGGTGKPDHTHIVPLPDVYRGIYREGDAGVKYAKHVTQLVEKVQASGRNIAGFICESIISCGGQIELPEGFLKLSYEQVRNAGGLCIADEVQVGCGRTGSHFWGFQQHGVIPDIVTIGKPIGNGHPLAVVVCTQEVAVAFANGMEYFNTFGGNPVSCAIGREVLQVIRDEKLQQHAFEMGSYLKTQLRKLQEKHEVIGDVRGQGLFLGVELADAHRRPLTAEAAYLVNRMKELGILMSTDGRDNNVLKIKPPMVFSRENADELIQRLDQVLSEDFLRVKSKPSRIRKYGLFD